MEDKIPSCPNCKGTNTCRIVYGYLIDVEVSQPIKEEKIISGGCVIRDDSPAWHCHDCQYRWGRYNHNKQIQLPRKNCKT